MTIEDVYNYVLNNLAPDKMDINYIDIKSFLDKLLNSKHIFSNRLLMCIGIDIKAYHLRFSTKKEVTHLISSYQQIILDIKKIRKPVTFDGLSIEPYIEFALAVKEFGMHNCKPEIISKDPQEYMRVTNFDTFINRIVPENKHCNPDITFDIEVIHNNKRFYEEFKVDESFREIRIANLSSSTGWVFALDKLDIEIPIQESDIAYVLDQIGYYIGDELPSEENKNQYITIEYPSNFSEEMLQPTALLGDWGKISGEGVLLNGNEFFLSYKKDNDWGKTFPVSGKGSGVKERAHKKFNKAIFDSYLFKINDFNRLDKLILKATDLSIFQAALERFLAA
ncbi:hypothetical protein [Parasediminibacterium sp. JCM 36343]|uniref:hypothetical protein n=1 Tax=Parasediminibacterium sp. JCM 36343 TaxID=3374279 RepID=UPI00397D46A8